MSEREYRDYVQDISDAIDAIEQFTQGVCARVVAGGVDILEKIQPNFSRR
ncbi:MAG: hypothetical protein K6T65_10095 [Peptococcaceae bacterium]|nr:hypothetical protein [Peptococcaceae bacterium]